LATRNDLYCRLPIASIMDSDKSEVQGVSWLLNHRRTATQFIIPGDTIQLAASG
jgi:hypothetical protein